MAMRSGSPVVPVFMARQKSGKYKLIIKPFIEAVCTDDYEADLRVNTQRFTKISGRYCPRISGPVVLVPPALENEKISKIEKLKKFFIYKK